MLLCWLFFCCCSAQSFHANRSSTHTHSCKPKRHPKNHDTTCKPNATAAIVHESNPYKYSTLLCSHAQPILPTPSSHQPTLQSSAPCQSTCIQSALPPSLLCVFTIVLSLFVTVYPHSFLPRSHAQPILPTPSSHQPPLQSSAPCQSTCIQSALPTPPLF